MPLTEDDTRWISEQLENDRRWMSEQLENLETKLLTEFHKWASPIDARLRTHTAAIRAVDLEMEALQERISKLEGRQST